MSITPTTCKRPGCTNPPTGGRGLCKKDWAVYRRKQIAYGRWDSYWVDPMPAQVHLAALRAAGMGTRRIECLTGLARPTIQSVATATSLGAATAASILAVPIPMSMFDPVLAPGTQIDALGTRRRLRALTAIGWPGQTLADLLSTTRNRVNALISGRQSKVTVRLARAAAELFDRLEITRGPSMRARRYAERQGWAQPLLWDPETIDSPAAADPFTEHDPLDFAQRIAEERFAGRDDDEVAELWGMKLGTLQQRLRRAGIPRTGKPAVAVAS